MSYEVSYMYFCFSKKIIKKIKHPKPSLHGLFLCNTGKTLVTADLKKVL
jgi:hypothetical protein